MLRVLTEDDCSRDNFLRACLTKLGLKFSQESSLVPSLSELHLSSSEPQLVTNLISLWKPLITLCDGLECVSGGTDTFWLTRKVTSCKNKLASSNFLLSQNENSIERRMFYQLASMGFEKGKCDFTSTGKQIIVHELNWPETKESPSFKHQIFYECLLAYQNKEDSDVRDFGKYLLYGEAVTSTNTILEK